MIPLYHHGLLTHVSPQTVKVDEGIVALQKPLTEAGRSGFFVGGLDLRLDLRNGR